MKYITILYLYLYITHVLLGPYFIWYLFSKTPFKWMTENIDELFNRSLWITYIGFLSIALFNEYPNSETFMVALLICTVATVGYFIKYENSEEHFKGTIDHIFLLMVPLILLFFYYKIDLQKYKPRYLSLIAIIYVLLMQINDTTLYKDGIDV